MSETGGECAKERQREKEQTTMGCGMWRQRLLFHIPVTTERNIQFRHIKSVKVSLLQMTEFTCRRNANIYSTKSITRSILIIHRLTENAGRWRTPCVPVSSWNINCNRYQTTRSETIANILPLSNATPMKSN